MSQDQPCEKSVAKTEFKTLEPEKSQSRALTIPTTVECLPDSDNRQPGVENP